MTTFPLTCAVQMRITPGSHPVEIYEMQNGATHARPFGGVPVGARIEARFMCTTAEAAAVVQAYHGTTSGALPVVLPPELFTGHEAMAAALPPLEWFFAAEPDSSPVRQGRVELSVEFSQRLEI